MGLDGKSSEVAALFFGNGLVLDVLGACGVVHCTAWANSALDDRGSSRVSGGVVTEEGFGREEDLQIGALSDTRFWLGLDLGCEAGAAGLGGE